MSEAVAVQKSIRNVLDSIKPSLDRLFERIMATGAVKFGKFMLRSGAISDHYFDVKRVLLDPEGLSLASRAVSAIVQGAFPGVNAVGGPELGVIPLVGGTLVRLRDGMSAEAPDKMPRGFMVRKAVKEYGTGNLIEGDVRPGDNVAMLEDVITTGGSVMKAVGAVNQVGATAVVIVTVVDRSPDDGDIAAWCRAAGIEFVSLFTGNELLARGRPVLG